MHLEILTPQKTIFNGEIKLIKVPGSQGSFEILKNHAPIISTLEKGEVKIVTTTDEVIQYTIDAGVVQAVDNKITVLAESLVTVNS
ncbi:MAG TPA: ATP synthase F1 subunit epsilon [Bacteroidales bacterium]|nr:ATP synthase F1 subunit epsilon [Bacteroidales bacterium]